MIGQSKLIQNKLTIFTLVIATFALLLAIIPPIVIEGEIKKLEKESIEYKDKFSLKIKGFELGFSEGKNSEKYEQNKKEIEHLENKKNLLKKSSLVFGATAFLFVILLLIKKQDIKFITGSIVMACTALAWQYIAAGITLAVTVIIILFSFGGNWFF